MESLGISWPFVQSLVRCKTCSRIKEVRLQRRNLLLIWKLATTSINIVDVHVATIRSKATKVQVFKEWELKKNKNIED
jgi:hypothetical protein